MGFFQRKVLGEEPVLSSLMVTFGQAIDATEKSNGFKLPEAWDLFINKVGFLADNKFISEIAMETIVYSSNFEVGRNLVLDLVKLRQRGDEVSQFAEEFKPLMEAKFPAGISFQKSGLSPKEFIDFLVQISKSKYPNFGSTLDDQKFYAILGIFFATVYQDSDFDKSSSKTFRRYLSFTIGLQLFSEWNISKDLR